MRPGYEAIGAVYTTPVFCSEYFGLGLADCCSYVLQLTQPLVLVPSFLSRTVQGAEASEKVKPKDFQLIEVPKSAVCVLDSY